MAGTGYAYLDASAIVKLAVVEPETAALERELLGLDSLLSLRLGAVEVIRAAKRADHRRLIQQVEDVLESFVLVELTPAIWSKASMLAPSELRTLDALHLSTAMDLGIPNLTFITYDQRLMAAADAAGLRTSQPGSPPKRETLPRTTIRNRRRTSR